MNSKQLETYNSARSLLSNLDSSFIDLGRILRLAQDEDKALYKQLMQLPGLDKRTAYYLIAISRTFDPLPVDRKELAKIGWTKLATIESFVTLETVNWLLDLARTHTDRELKDHLTGKTPTKKARVVLLYMQPPQYEAYRKALLKFGAFPFGKGLGDQEVALMKLIKQAFKKAGS